MIDQPDAVTLLEAMGRTLTDRVVPALDGGVQHDARVVANLCRILARELVDGGGTHDALVEWAGYDDDLVDLVAELDAAIEQGDRSPELFELLLTDVVRRAEITRPGYTQTDDD